MPQIEQTYTLVRNSAWCSNCFMEIESLSIHHTRYCRCGNTFVDGGLAYRHHGWRHARFYLDTSIYSNGAGQLQGTGDRQGSE